MEKIGNIGWFLTNEEMAKLQGAFETLRLLLPRPGEEENLTITGVKENGIPYTPPGSIDIDPCPNCPWKGKEVKPWVNPADWTWRPEQAPWYGAPGEPIHPDDWKIGDPPGWWKDSPYCTSTSGLDPNEVEETKTTGNKNEKSDLWKELKKYTKKK